jgi:hypothetical protein
MMHDCEKSHSAIVAARADEQSGRARCGAGGAKGGDREERGRAKHAPDTESGARVTGQVRVLPSNTRGKNRMP